MKKLIVISAVASVAILVVVGFFPNGVRGVFAGWSEPSAEKMTEETGVGSSVDKLKLHRDSLSSKNVSVHPLPGVPRSRDGLEMESDPFAPTSRADQKWLDRNGYPNAAQLLAYGRASDAVLEQAAKAGDIVARVELDGRRLIAGDEKAASDLFVTAADGSMYALAKLAAFRGGSKANGDPVQAYALSRVSEMLGNYRAGISRDFVVQHDLDPLRRAEAEATAIALYEDLIELRRARNGPGAPVADPRPVGKDK